MKYAKILPGITTILVVVGILYFSYLVLKPFLFILLVSLIISVFLNPLYERILNYLNHRSLSAILTLVVLIVFILIPVSFILGSTVTQAKELISLLQEKPTLLIDTQNYIMQQMHLFGIPSTFAEFDIQNEAVGLLKKSMQKIGGSLLFVGSMLLNVFLILITTFFFLTNKKRIATYWQETELISHVHFQKIQTRTVDLINGIVRGNLFVVALQMLIGTIAFLLFGLPAPLFLGMLYGILSLVPVVGALLISIPSTVAIFFLQGPTAALALIGYFVVTNLVVDNVIAPKIIGDQTKLHQLLIMFSVVGGIQQYGFIGIVLGPVTVALAFVAIEIYKDFAGSKPVDITLKR